MPICRVVTSLKSAEIPSDFNVQMAKKIAEVLSKPIEVSAKGWGQCPKGDHNSPLC